ESTVPVVQAEPAADSLQRSPAPELVLADGSAPVEAAPSPPAPVVGVGNGSEWSAMMAAGATTEGAAPSAVPVVHASDPSSSLQRAFAEALVLASAAAPSADPHVPVVSADAASPNGSVRRASADAAAVPVEGGGSADAAVVPVEGGGSADADTRVPIVPAAAAVGDALASPEM